MIQVYLVMSIDKETGDQAVEGCYGTYGKANEAVLGLKNEYPSYGISIRPITVE